MNNFLEFITKDIEAKKTLLSSMPTNNKTNIKKYNEKIEAITANYLDYKDSMQKYIIAKSNSFEIVDSKRDNSLLAKKVEELKDIIYLLEPTNSFIEKLKIDNLLFDLTNYTSFSFKELNDKINSFIEKFELIGVKLQNSDFNYTYYVQEYMKTFLQLRSLKQETYDELSAVFEQIYWFNPEIIEHIELNFRKLLKKFSKEFNNYIQKEQKRILQENNFANFEAVKLKYNELYNELSELNEEQISDIVEMSKKGELEIKNYFSDSKFRITTFESLIVTPLNTEEKENKFLLSITKLKNNIEEYKSYIKFKELFEYFKEQYPISKGEFSSKIKAIEDSINEKEDKLDKINKKIFSGDDHKLFDFKKENNLTVKELKIESLKLAKDLYSLYKQLDDEKLKNTVVPLISDATLIGDVIKIYYNYNYFRRDSIKNVLKLDDYNEVIRIDNEFCSFVQNPNNVIVNGIYVYDENDVQKMIINKYRFENINLNEEELANDLDLLLNKLKFILRVNKLEKSQLSVEKVWFMTEVSSIIKQEETKDN